MGAPSKQQFSNPASFATNRYNKDKNTRKDSILTPKHSEQNEAANEN